MNISAPAACSVRAISAPTRRAPPVMSRTWPRSGELSILGSMGTNDTAMALQPEISLNDVQMDHCSRMRACLEAQIAAAGGWLSFERFMDTALYEPGLGYYSAGARKLGAGGDFTTAPEVSRLFGACVARQCAEILSALGGGCILEIGAGSGRLAGDMLLRLDTLGKLPDSYRILEISAPLRGAGRGGEELGGAIEQGRFAWEARPASPPMAETCRHLSQAGGAWDDGYVSEYCPRLTAWARGVTQSLRTGAALWFDYGLPPA